MAAKVGGRSTLEGGTEDWRRAFRQKAVWHQHARFIIVAVWNPYKRCVVLVKYRCLLFGFKSAVIYFNNTPALITAFLRRVLAVIVAHYFDDKLV